MPFNPTDPPLPLTDDHGDYDEIRGVLMVGLKANKVSNAYIAMTVHQGQAELAVKRSIPDAETMLGNQHVRLAAIYLTASALCGSMVQILRADANEAWSYQVNAIDWTQKAKDLAALADEQIAIVLAEGQEPPPLPDIPMLILGNGGRGKWG